MKDLARHNFSLGRHDFENINRQKAIIVWLTGLSGAGKSTIANLVQLELLKSSKRAVVLDGDDFRTGLCRDLSFSQADRLENLRRASEVAKLFCNNGIIVIACFISPLQSQREYIKKNLNKDYHEVFIDAPLEICSERDPKGLYKDARLGGIPNLTGVNSNYEKPNSPDLIIRTDKLNPQESADKLLVYINDLVEL